MPRTARILINNSPHHIIQRGHNRQPVFASIQEVLSERQVVVHGALYSAEEQLSAEATGTFATLSAQAALRLGVMRPEYRERFASILNQNQGA